MITDGSAIPVVSFRLAGDFGYTEFDVSHALRAYGWQVPAYTMPEDATDIAVLRVVVREGFSADMARALRDDTDHRTHAPRRAQAPGPLRPAAAVRALSGGAT